ncbi:hypothetical protein BC830DRAFT_1165576 [Chytriomyces sp. MP71]|nr:hypothetical protein BC830DRAFT_1165576 [Chytriomyces sp. MP71]
MREPTRHKRRRPNRRSISTDPDIPTPRLEKAAKGRHSLSYPPPWLSLGGIALGTGLGWHTATLPRILSSEIAQLCAYLSSTQHESLLRKYVACKYSSLVSQRFPLAKVLAFGSSGTGLFLPWSDIDLIVVDPFNSRDAVASVPVPRQGSQSSKLSKLFSKINQSRECSSLQILKRARVPILKLCDKDSGISLDICYNVTGGLAAVEAVRAWVQRVEGLRELVLLVKLMLHGKDLAEVFTGGVGGYAIVVWCLAFIKIRQQETHAAESSRGGARKRKRASAFESPSHGTRFLEFCQYFGSEFDFHSYGIAFHPTSSPLEPGTPYLFDKRTHSSYQPTKPYMFALMNPLEEGMDLTKGSSRIGAVAACLEGAVKSIERAWGRFRIRESSSLMDKDETRLQSLLSEVVFVSKDMVRRRGILHQVSRTLFGENPAHDDLVEELSFPMSKETSVAPTEFMITGISMQDSDLDAHVDNSNLTDTDEIVAAASDEDEPDEEAEPHTDFDLGFIIDRTGQDQLLPADPTASESEPKASDIPIIPKKRTGFNGRDNRTAKSKAASTPAPSQPPKLQQSQRPHQEPRTMSLSSSASKKQLKRERAAAYLEEVGQAYNASRATPSKKQLKRERAGSLAEDNHLSRRASKALLKRERVPLYVEDAEGIRYLSKRERAGMKRVEASATRLPRSRYVMREASMNEFWDSEADLVGLSAARGRFRFETDAARARRQSGKPSSGKQRQSRRFSQRGKKAG